MSHYLTFVLIPENGEVDQCVSALMEPHRTDASSEGFWDFFQIGGRWTGIFDGYKPEEDPLNIETCWLCQGTGNRRDMVVANGCNGCRGAGKRVKWPTGWVRHAGDVVSAEAALKSGHVPHTIVGDGGFLSMHDSWNGEDIVDNPEHAAKVKHALTTHVGRVVVVDYHS